MPPVALTIAGSDPSGGAGIQADLKTFHQFQVYGEAAITLLTVQNTRGVTRVEPAPAEIIRQQVEAVISDIPPQAAKTGALGGVEQVEVVAAMAAAFSFPLVVDPVMTSKQGARLLTNEAENAVRTRLLPHCALVTPNIAEAEVLSGSTIDDLTGVEEAVRRIAQLGPGAVLVKGGHLEGAPIDVLYFRGAIHRLRGKRVPTQHTHGTGCVFSAAITALLAHGLAIPDAVRSAKQFIQRAIETAPGLGSGPGPVNLFASASGPRQLIAASS
ncbi:MAG: bifunctional hydroxymethylpyrimidine kinase/phosphomethylpyrimidine kinase [Bryobacteraceae bacterium]